MSLFRLVSCLLLLFTGDLGLVQAQEWSRFRGPNGTGFVPAAGLPTTWTEKDYNWKVSLPAVGHSSPVLWGEKLFVTSAEPATGKRLLLCLNTRDGKTLWSKESDAKTYKMHKRNSVATSTPVADAERVYALWTTPEQVTAVAFSHDGVRAWEANLGKFKSQHGGGVSPIRFEDLLIVPNEQDGGGSLIALEASTGKVRWQVPRQSQNATYSTPCLYQPAGRPPELILTNWQLGVTGIDPRTGKTNWSASVFDTKTQERAIASPVIAGDLVLATCGFVTGKKEFVALRPGPDKAQEVWRLERAVSYLPTPLVQGDRTYLCTEVGIASCLESATGKVLWQERLPGNFSASPVCTGPHLYCVANNGDVFVLQTGDTFRLAGKAALGEPTQSTPAIAGDRIYFRTEKSLISLGGGKQ
jgi:outer membrane protein assembly factor BamB